MGLKSTITVKFYVSEKSSCMSKKKTNQNLYRYQFPKVIYVKCNGSFQENQKTLLAIVFMSRLKTNKSKLNVETV